MNANRFWRCVIWMLLTACGEAQHTPELHKINGVAQGTTYHLTFWSDAGLDDAALSGQVEAVFDEIDRHLSNYRPDSAVEQFNRQQTSDPQTVPEELVALVRAGQTMYALSQGCFDLTIKDDRLKLPSHEQLQQTRQLVGMDKIRVIDDRHLSKNLAGLRIDVSALAQGYSVGRISDVLASQGIRNYMVEIGGELKTQGHKPDGSAWRVALEKPLADQRSVQRIVTLPIDQAMSVMASGTYRHFFDWQGVRYSHILDARTGSPVTHDLVSATVLHENPVVADAWSTALLCLGQPQGMALANREKIKVLFIQQQGANLIESRSQSLLAYLVETGKY
jgi:FAD:protein FMN transferase